MNSNTTGLERSNIILWIITGIAFGLTVYAFYPGYMSYDASNQYWQLRTGSLSTQHPPFMVFVWMLTNSIIEGPGGLLIMNLALYWLALKLISDALFTHFWSRVLFILILGFWPYNLLLIPNILKDVCMMTGFMMAVACVLQHQETRKRTWLAGVVLFTLYASLLRHNAIFGAIPLYYYVASTLFQPRFFHGAMVFMALLVATITINYTIAGLPMVKRQVVWPTLVLWDLAHISVREDVIVLPDFTVGPGLTTEVLNSVLSPWTNVTLFAGEHVEINTGLHGPHSREQYHELLKAWALAIARYPDSYLAHRIELSSALYGLKSYPLVLAHAYGGRIVPFRDNPEFQKNQTRLNRAILIPLTKHVESWPFKGWIYALVCVLLFILAWPLRRNFRYQRVLLLSLSGLIFTAPLFIIAPAAPMRFHSWLVMSALIAIAALISALRSQSRPHGKIEKT